MAVLAQSEAGAGSLTVVDGLSIGFCQPMTVIGPLGNPKEGEAMDMAATTIVEIHGVSDQAYSISFPPTRAEADALTVEDMSAWSDNAEGDIATGRSGQLDANGHDTLRLNGRIHVAHGTTASDLIAEMTIGFHYQ